jgi:L-alanine-DL-glutamate epimerase-like enolase superfamily enzyme
MTPRVEDVSTRLLRVPLTRPWALDVTELHVVVAEVRTEDGLVGTGFSWTPGVGAGAVRALLDDDVAPFVVGRAADPASVWDALWAHLHEAGAGGLTTTAMAAVDLGLWDLAGLRTGQSLVDLLGRRRGEARVYGSGVNFHYTREELVEQAHRWRKAGFAAVKIKVGRADVEEDLVRVAAVREVVGERTRLMLDANQRWDVPSAIRALGELSRFGPAWIEEPLLSDDLDAHAALRRHTDIPVALGENLSTRYQFRDAFVRRVCDYAQPNVVRVGGVTPFLRIASLAESFGVTVAPHLLPDLSTQLALCLPHDAWVEHVEDASFEDLGVLARRSGVRLDGSRASASTGPGHGLRFDVPIATTRTD